MKKTLIALGGLAPMIVAWTAVHWPPAPKHGLEASGLSRSEGDKYFVTCQSGVIFYRNGSEVAADASTATPLPGEPAVLRS